MKLKILIILLFFNVGMTFCTDYSKIDKQSVTVPQNLRTANDITRYLTRNLTSPTEKVRAIYFWIAHNITYDVAKMNSSEQYTDPQQLVDKVLKNRKGVCSHYAALFNACCHSAGITSYIIEGYTRQNGRVVGLAHAWNAVKIDNRFYEIDATWAAGFLNGSSYTHQFRDNFFLISPVEFIKSHMPVDPIWQFLNNPITHTGFDDGDFSALKKGSDYNYSDSIDLQSGLNLLDKFVRENERILKSGLSNGMIRNKYVQNQQHIGTGKYNAATDDFNKGVEKYNEYVQLKNTQFNHLSIKDEAIMELLSTARQLIESAEETLSILNSGDYGLYRSIGSLRESIRALKRNLDKEDLFVGKYVRTVKPLRMVLFYSRNK